MLVVTLLACAPGALEDGFEDALTDTGGCGDVFVYARDPDRTVGIVVRTDDALVSSAPESQTYDLASDASLTDRWVTAYQGVEVGELWCNDVSTGAERLDRSWHAVSGSLEIAVTPQDYGGLADVTITDATLESDDGEATVPLSFAWTAVSVGWLPG